MNQFIQCIIAVILGVLCSAGGLWWALGVHRQSLARKWAYTLMHIGSTTAVFACLCIIFPARFIDPHILVLAGAYLGVSMVETWCQASDRLDNWAKRIRNPEMN